jgi:Fe-S oxidoreductase
MKLARVTPFRLPMLEPHRAALENCVYCPKLSRAACPVSNIEHSETVTPWGKMSMAYFAARGDVPIDAEHAAPAWACTACYACRERCDHGNDVAHALSAARASTFMLGAAPAAARAIAARFDARRAEVARAVDRLEGDAPPARAPAMLVGCAYARCAPDVAADAIRAVIALLGVRVRLVRACCGLPLLHAGDRDGFLRAARGLIAEASRAPGAPDAAVSRLLVVDPGCARALETEYPRAGLTPPAVDLFLDLVAQRRERLQQVAGLPSLRWHDPCQLGRGLGRFDEPRAILRQIGGLAPLEFQRARRHAECSGGGGLLPATRPESARAIAAARVGEHRALGGGVLVTGCAQSLHRFRRAGEPAEDIASLVARAVAP